MNDWTDTGSYAYNKLQSENEDLKRLVESQCYDLDAMSAIKEERDQLQEQNLMLDAEAAKDEVLLRQCLQELEHLRVVVDEECGAGRDIVEIEIAGDLWPVITDLRERLK
jgi:hypothetical protein